MMNGLPQAEVLVATLAEGSGARGPTCSRGWAGASSLIGFRNDKDEQGRPTFGYSLECQPPAARRRRLRARQSASCWRAAAAIRRRPLLGVHGLPSRLAGANRG